MKQKESLLNDEQKSIYDFVSDCLNKGISEKISIAAPGGTGKTFFINLILAKVRSTGNIAVTAASSGMAVKLIPGGRTAHSKIPLTVKENELCDFDKNSNSANLFRNTKIIIWDECPMMVLVVMILVVVVILMVVLVALVVLVVVVQVVGWYC